jgi:hypothetical protein
MKILGRTLVFDPTQKKDQNPGHQYTFYEVLQVLYNFISQEAQNDEGKALEEMQSTKRLIVQLATDLGNSAYLDNWYDLEEIEDELIELVDYDEETGGYTSRSELME